MFVDIGRIQPTLMSPSWREAVTPRTKAVLAVDAASAREARRHPEVAERHGLVFIEDSCESLGSDGKKAGGARLRPRRVFAFYPNKQITTGEGGLIVTDDDRIAQLCDSMCNQGRGESGLWLAHERLGYNYRMDEMSAALGVVRMGRLDEIIEGRARVAAMYARGCRA